MSLIESPSSSALKPRKVLAFFVAHFRSSANPCGKLSPAQKPFPTGKNSFCPAGIEQLRTTAGGPGGKNVPARNQTSPDCPTAQFAPVVSRTGLLAGGGSYAHLNHLALHSPYVRPPGAEFGVRTTPGFGSFGFCDCAIAGSVNRSGVIAARSTFEFVANFISFLLQSTPAETNRKKDNL